MLKEERQRFILDTLKSSGRVVAAELSRHFGVSEDTIRRDLRELTESGHMQRVHGGALPHSPASAPFIDRLQQAPQAKEAIAQAAARLVQDGQVVLLDGGTTTLMVARRFSPDLRATVVTNSPLIAGELANHATIEIVLIGGRLYKNSVVTTGAPVVDALRKIHTDICMLGVCSLHPRAGITVPDLEEAYVKRAMIENSTQVVALASSEKLGTASTYEVGPIQWLSRLITDQTVTEQELDAYRAEGILAERV